MERLMAISRTVSRHTLRLAMTSMMFCFFTMGFVDLVGIALVGYGNSNVFSMCFSQAMLYMPEKNAISGLMIMGLFGGTIFPLVMGIASDAVHSQVGAVAVMAIGVIYLLTFIKQVKY